MFPCFIPVGNSAPTAAAVWPRMSKQKIAGRADISNPAIGGITLRNTLKYGSVTDDKFLGDNQYYSERQLEMVIGMSQLSNRRSLSAVNKFNL